MSEKDKAQGSADAEHQNAPPTKKSYKQSIEEKIESRKAFKGGGGGRLRSRRRLKR
jgi:hypothetical protein